MKVQRAPRSSAQPQRPLVDGLPSRRAAPVPSGMPIGSTFSAGVDLDLTDSLRRLDEPGAFADVIAHLVFACRHEGIANGGTSIRLLRPTAHGLVGVVLKPGEELSGQAIVKAMAAPADDLPPTTFAMVTVIDIGSARARAVGDWGLGGTCVATLGSVVPTIVSRRPAGDTSLSLAERMLAHLDLTVNDAGLHAHRAMRALDVLARAVEGSGR